MKGEMPDYPGIAKEKMGGLLEPLQQSIKDGILIESLEFNANLLVGSKPGDGGLVHIIGTEENNTLFFSASSLVPNDLPYSPAHLSQNPEDIPKKGEYWEKPIVHIDSTNPEYELHQKASTLPKEGIEFEKVPIPTYLDALSALHELEDGKGKIDLSSISD